MYSLRTLCFPPHGYPRHFRLGPPPRLQRRIRRTGAVNSITIFSKAKEAGAHEFPHVVRQWRGEGKPFAGPRVVDRKRGGVQGMTRAVALCSTVLAVSVDRQPGVR
eukprot:2875684-Prymnesium_polylepis.2